MNQTSKQTKIYHNIYSNIPVPICVFNSSLSIIYINKPFENLFGYLQVELLNITKWIDYCCIEPDQKNAMVSKIKSELLNIQNGGDSIKMGIYKMFNRNLMVKKVEITINNLDGNVLMTTQDRSIVEKVENEILKEKDFTEKLINSLPGFFYLFRFDGENIAQLVRWNKQGETLSGYNSNELLNKPLLEFFLPTEKNKVIKSIHELIKHKEFTIETRFLLRNGKTIPFKFKAKVFTDAGTHYFYGIGDDLTESKQAELKLRESKLRYKLLSDLTFEGILIHENGIALDMNETFANIFEYKPNELLGKNVIDLLGSEKDKPTMYHYMKINYQLPYEVTAFKKSGEKFKAEITGREIIHEGKKARVVSIRDISERERKEKELDQKNLLVQRITEQSLDIIYIYDIEKNENIYINKDLGEILGYTKTDLPESSISITRQLIHPDDKKQFIDAYKDNQKLSDDYVFEFIYRLKAKDGNWKWFSGKEKPFQREDGRVKTMLGTILDITTQKKYEEALLKSEEQLSTIFENAPMIMVLITEEGEILKMNKNAVLLAKGNEKAYLNKLIGKAFNCINSVTEQKGCGQGIHCKSCSIRRIINKTFNNQRNYSKAEASLKIEEDGYVKEYFLQLSSSLLKEMSPPAALITVDDITERKLLEIDLNEAKEKAEESNKLKTAFLQNMSHEIRTPMNGIIGFSDMLTRENISEERRKNYTNVIVKCSQQLLEIVNDILDISKIETGQAETNEFETSVNHLLGELLNLYRPLAWQKNLSISLNQPLDNEDSFIWVDSLKLKQLLNNLLSNALKFTKEGFIRFGYKIASTELLFYVEDTGIGIDKKFHEKIFEQFRQLELTTTREFGGTGLGLAISRAYAKLLGGELWLESEKGKGTKFYFTLPYRPVSNKPVKSIEIRTKPLLSRNQNILLAEDEYANFLIFKELLSDYEVNLVHAKNGLEAIEWIQKREFSLAFIDIKMPKMNGYQVVEEIKKLQPDLPVVAQTAFATNEDRDKIFESGFDEYLSKPFTNSMLYDVMKKYLRIESDGSN